MPKALIILGQVADRGRVRLRLGTDLVADRILVARAAGFEAEVETGVARVEAMRRPLSRVATLVEMHDVQPVGGIIARPIDAHHHHVVEILFAAAFEAHIGRSDIPLAAPAGDPHMLRPDPVRRRPDEADPELGLADVDFQPIKAGEPGLANCGPAPRVAGAAQPIHADCPSDTVAVRCSAVRRTT
ncbi:MAG TPA: hypothetical protein VF079_01825 [Sphingomicrobium sp.]